MLLRRDSDAADVTLTAALSEGIYKVLRLCEQS